MPTPTNGSPGLTVQALWFPKRYSVGPGISAWIADQGRIWLLVEGLPQKNILLIRRCAPPSAGSLAAGQKFAAAKTFNVLDFGAKGDGASLKYPGGVYDNRPTKLLTPLEPHATDGFFFRYADKISLENCSARWPEKEPGCFLDSIRAETVTDLRIWSFKGESAAHPLRVK